MTIQNAINFITTTMNDSSIRVELYKMNTRVEFENWLIKKEIPFQMSQFEECVNLLHVKCQTIEEADALLHKVDWMRMYWHSLT